MGSMTERDVDEFRHAVHGVLGRFWSRPTDADTGDLGKLWDAAVEYGWFQLGAAGELTAAIAATRELGAVACPLPLMDGYVACLLLGTDPFGAEVAAGNARVVVVPPNDGVASFVEAGPLATHAVVLPAGDRDDPLIIRRISGVRETPGLALPSWSEIILGDETGRHQVAPGARAWARTVLRLGLAARATAAAARAHELAVEHAKVRRQFGKPIGSFGAVQQRTANNQIAVSANGHLVDEALRRAEAEAPDRSLAAEIAVEHARSAVPGVQLGAHHTLAAIGYFDEHEGPWLFRRVHADLTRLDLFPLLAGDVADVLVETSASLPSLELGPVAEAFRREVVEVLDAHEVAGDPLKPFGDGRALAAELVARGWLGFQWPVEHGGRNASAAEQIVLHDELKYRRAPTVLRELGAVMLLGNAIVRFGSEAQKAAFLPQLRSGELLFCLGYSEPEAGSDLASLRTRADRDGDEWVINGQKLWTTRGHEATHVWLAVRTDQAAEPRHAGISVFFLPMDTPGISLQQHRSLSGEICCTVFYDEVRVPDSARIGEVNEGWRVITDALASERVLMGGIAVELCRQLDDLLAHVRRDPVATLGPRGSARRARLGGLAVHLQATRVLLAAASAANAGGGGAQLETPMAAILGSELAEDFGEAMLELLGPLVTLSGAEPDVPGGGWFEYGLRSSIKSVIGGGTNDIQRGLIARGLGLPR